MVLDDLIYKTDLSKEEVVFLLQLQNKVDLEKLIKRADEVRKQYCGDEVHLRGIIEFSNNCEQECLYCGLRKGNYALNRYRMNEEEIIRAAKDIIALGIKTIVLQSGEDFYYSGDYLARIISGIKNIADVAITISVGEREFSDYKLWRQAGADRYLLKHETANPKLYSIYHQRQKLLDRIKHLRFLKSIGFQIGSGNIIGLPHQTIEDIADDILLCKELNVDMASFSPFIPSENTPYINKEKCSVELVIKTLALTRIVLKDAHIPATTALATLDPHGREMALTAGANIIMPNFTPHPYKENYLIYANKNRADDDDSGNLELIKKIINSAGRKIGESQGHSLKINNV
ncbi:MAG TPA: [FeFe] hydrogenase H-cluster radical SAM maturase HydE [Ignavibacteriaceae bacterium]|nr:[FeFe] hydrogenase H-cluster radical SAM maturase HydE [Ignavibacteriaceae bacterium]